MNCNACGSSDIVENVRIVDIGHGNSKTDLQLEVYASPEAWVFKGAQQADLWANVCAQCGHVMLYIDKVSAAAIKQYKNT